MTSEKHFFAKIFGNLDIYHYICTNYIELLMKKKLLIIFLGLAALVCVPMTALASEADFQQTEQTIDEDITFKVNGQWVTVTGAQGQTLEVVSLTGRRVMTIKIESPAQRVELNVPKGCYILKIGKVVRKVAVQ